MLRRPTVLAVAEPRHEAMSGLQDTMPQSRNERHINDPQRLLLSSVLDELQKPQDLARIKSTPVLSSGFWRQVLGFGAAVMRQPRSPTTNPKPDNLKALT